MKFNGLSAAVSAALLAGAVRADDVTVDEAAPVVPELPTFTVRIIR